MLEDNGIGIETIVNIETARLLISMTEHLDGSYPPTKIGKTGQG